VAEAAALANLERKDGNKTMKICIMEKKGAKTGNNLESCRK
jgi:hypothetical protein